jgi:PIN domain nuclease of toxin-antitoxin system
VESILDGGALALPISLEHAAEVEELAPHHRDPFDRILVAQALIERAVIVTKDAAFAPYEVAVVW